MTEVVFQNYSREALIRLRNQINEVLLTEPETKVFRLSIECVDVAKDVSISRS